MHLDDETLRALVDHEDSRSLMKAGAQEHLSTCGECRARQEAMQARSARVEARLAALDPGPTESPRSVQSAFTQIVARQPTASRKVRFGMVASVFTQRLRPVWIGLTLIVLAAVALSFEPVRVWAGDLLALFRVQRITVISVDSTRLTDLLGGTTFSKQVAQLLSDSVKVTKEATKPQAVANAAQASKLTGFAVRLPASRSDAPYITVEGGTAFQFTVNRARAQSLMDQMGGKGLQLPASVDGALVRVDIPMGVSAAYGNCPKLDQPQSGSPARRMANCVVLVEIPSPTVDVPPQVNLTQLAEIGLQFSGMNAQQARAYSKTVDWATTLVVPIPRNAASYKQVTVDGVNGYLIQRPADDAPQYALVWVKDGIVYAIASVGSDTTTAMAMANSLR